MKAITITKANQNKVAGQYNIHDFDLEDVLPVGYILIAPFGYEPKGFEVVTQDTFDLFYTRGEDLENGYW